MEIKVGDKVRVLRGQFAGETGVIVGIIVCGRNYADPYYEVDMDCDVPEKYKCRKSLISKNNVIGGLSAYEFEVIGNRTHTEPTAQTIKVGDMVRCKSPLRLKSSTDDDFIGTVTDIESGWFRVRMNNGAIFQSNNAADLELVQPKEQTEAEKTDTDNIVDDFAKVMEDYRKVFADIADNFDWQRYEADLAKEIALKVANKYSDPKEAADYAVSVAKAVVENLRKK